MRSRRDDLSVFYADNAQTVATVAIRLLVYVYLMNITGCRF